MSKTLIEQIKRDAVCEGFKKIYLCTDLQGFYEKHGFSYIGNGQYLDGEISRIYEAILE